ncbi:glycoside hydrolase/phage tail family protein [Rhizobium sp. YIM 134829]|uniref:baseplate multidomain protein megatron n=1 Tax=Rhizobium sp. YIM 134829 TaxID=3390453 RepID=UPI00397AD2CF
MATIVLQTAGAALGSVFGPIGTVLGRAVGALAGAAVDHALFSSGAVVSGSRLADARIPGAEEGTAITRLYGTMRIGGTLIWATRFEESVHEERDGGKASGQRVETFRYAANLAIGICEGKIAGVRRVWADGRELDLTTVEMRLYTGSETQAPDPLIEAKQGAGRAPAYRGLAYAVFERLPLAPYGNRIPLIQFEAIRPVGRLERLIKAVTLIPGSTEHGYETVVVSDKTGAGEKRLINRNVFHAETDWQASLDELQAVCPNLERVALVVAWFGTDSRAGRCAIRPGVETRTRRDESKAWRVSGIDRGSAHSVSHVDGAPAYGGTPSDESVLSAIADLKARGLKVYLYPFLMMDVPPDNSLPDPYGGAQQAAYPWRGRITGVKAPGRPGSSDRTAAARAEIASFCGQAQASDFEIDDGRVISHASDEGYRRFVLHHAQLAKLAGGVEGFIIGSELRGLTTLRDETDAFPFVSALIDLAGDVRSLLGPATKLTYGADWSEYFGYQPQDGTGNVYFHLDPLWAASAIDAIGIDSYMPLSDWRDEDLNDGNPDGMRTPEDKAAFRAMMAAGEGFDWYYNSDAARRSRTRTTITDGLAGKPWVFRYKDLASWWTNRHYERVGGVEKSLPTAFVPRAKPIWLTETGCPAIDKGGNQPNVFLDPKSSESFAPYFSRGGRADALQRRVLEAQHDHWRAEAGASGVDADHLFVWTWDARPVPAFPGDGTVFADSANWTTGHWLNGRLGTASAADAITAILKDHGIDAVDTALVCGDLGGFVQSEVASARDLLEPLMQALSIDATEEGDKLVFASRLQRASPPLALDVLAEEEGALFETERGHESDFASEAVLDHLDPDADYGRATARSRRVAPGNDRLLRLSLPAALHETAALDAVASALRDHQASRDRLRFSLPPTRLDLAPGDVVTLGGAALVGPAGRYLIERIEDGAARRAEARALVLGGSSRLKPRRLAGQAPRRASAGFDPVVRLLDLPAYRDGPATDFAKAAAFSRPWKPVVLSASPTREGYQSRLSLERPAKIGVLGAPLAPGVRGRFDTSQALILDLPAGALASASRIAVLNGANRLAVFAANGAIEIIGFAEAEEVAAGRWRLTALLRGLAGTTDALSAGAPIGAEVVVLDGAVKSLGLAVGEAGRALNWIAEPKGGLAGPPEVIRFAGGRRAETPFAPVHLRALRQANGAVSISWIRCTRQNGDAWDDGEVALDEPEEAYRLEILSGASIVRRAETTAPRYLYASADELADFGTRQATLSLRVRQRGRVVSLGLPASGVLPV